jgi:Berberine and berberine like
MRPWATGMNCLNFMGVEDARTQVVRTAYHPADFARLAELKARYDPANTFRINFNIPPRQQDPDGNRIEASAPLALTQAVARSMEESREDRYRIACRGAGRRHDHAGAVGGRG